MKTSLVTGGASGIGIEFVKLLLKDNYKVFIVDNDKNNIESLKDKLDSDNYESIYEDLCYQKSPDKIYKKLKKENIDILINNAGFGTYGKFYETDWQIEKRMLNLHVINTTHLTKLFLKDMIKKNDGKILNISSNKQECFCRGVASKVLFATPLTKYSIFYKKTNIKILNITQVL